MAINHLVRNLIISGISGMAFERKCSISHTFLRYNFLFQPCHLTTSRYDRISLLHNTKQSECSCVIKKEGFCVLFSWIEFCILKNLSIMSSSTTPKKDNVQKTTDVAVASSSSKKRCIELVSSSNSIERINRLMNN